MLRKRNLIQIDRKERMMKKLLAIIGSITMVVPASVSIVSCSSKINDDSSSNDNKEPTNPKSEFLEFHTFNELNNLSNSELTKFDNSISEWNNNKVNKKVIEQSTLYINDQLTWNNIEISKEEWNTFVYSKIAKTFLDMKNEIAKSKTLVRHNLDKFITKEETSMSNISFVNDYYDFVAQFNENSKPSLNELIHNKELGYLSSNSLETIKEALWIKNQNVKSSANEDMNINNELNGITMNQINSLNFDIKDRYIEVTDSTNKYKDKVKLSYDSSFKKEWMLDIQNRISAQDLGLQKDSLRGELKIEGKDSENKKLYLQKSISPKEFMSKRREVSGIDLLNLDNPKTTSANEMISDFTWIKDDLFLGLVRWKSEDSGNYGAVLKNELSLFKFDENNNIVELKRIPVTYIQNPSDPDRYKWDLIDRIDENTFSIANTAGALPETVESDAITYINVNWEDNLATARVVNKVDKYSTIGINKVYSQSGYFDSYSDPKYLGKMSTALLNYGQIKVTKKNIASLPAKQKYLPQGSFLMYTRKLGTDKTKKEWRPGILNLDDGRNGWKSSSLHFCENDQDVAVSYTGDSDVMFTPIQNENIYSSIQDQKGRIWVNTDNYLYPVVYFTA